MYLFSVFIDCRVCAKSSILFVSLFYLLCLSKWDFHLFLFNSFSMPISNLTDWKFYLFRSFYLLDIKPSLKSCVSPANALKSVFIGEIIVISGDKLVLTSSLIVGFKLSVLFGVLLDLLESSSINYFIFIYFFLILASINLKLFL